MSIRLATLIASAIVLMLVAASPSQSDGDVQFTGGTMQAAVSEDQAGSASPGSPPSTSNTSAETSTAAGTWKTRVACGGICPPLTTQCDGGVQPLWLYFETPDGQETNGGLYCPEDIPVAAAAAPPTVTPALVLSELRRIALPAAALTIQPPNGKTLVNFPTNFFTEAGPFTRTVTLLGQQVTLDIRPAAYTWHFGDGEDRSTSGPGAPYPALDITHTYASEGAQDPSVDITYEADFRVGNGPTQPVPGTVTIDGAAVDLTVVEARPQLVGSY